MTRHIKTPQQLREWRAKGWKPLGYRGALVFQHVGRCGRLDVYARDLAEDSDLAQAFAARFAGEWGQRYDFPCVRIAGQVRRRY